MERNGRVKQHLGTILCSYCGNIIDTVDTDKVQTFYMLCQDEACVEKRTSRGELKHEERPIHQQA